MIDNFASKSGGFIVESLMQAFIKNENMIRKGKNLIGLKFKIIGDILSHCCDCCGLI
jgi:hypothetical protein